MNYAPILIEIVEYVEKHIHRPISLDEISSTFFISKFHFHRIFKVYTGTTFSKYCTKRRLQHIGDDILGKPNLEIWKIALDYSYNQPQVLNRVFKKHYKATPTEYRKNNEKMIVQDKLKILEKETISLNGKIMANFSLHYRKKRKLYGKLYNIDLRKTKFSSKELTLYKMEKSLLFSKSIKSETIFFISIKENEKVSKFGIFTLNKLKGEDTFNIPNSLYAVIHYSGNPLHSSIDIVSKDVESIFYKKHLKPNTKFINGIKKFQSDDNNSYSIGIPVEFEKK